MAQEKIVNVFCAPHCLNYPCEFQVKVVDERATKLEIHPKMQFPPCLKGWTSIKRLYHPDRLLYPMKRVGERGEGRFERISWDEALDTVVQRLNSIKAKYGNEAILMYHYVAWHGYPGVGTVQAPKSTVLRLFNLWGGCIPAYHRGSLCWQALIQAMQHLFGTINVALPPYDDCKLIMVWSTNPAETGYRGHIQALTKAKARGTKMIVVDPVFTPTAAVLADEHLPIRPGTDTALALAMTNLIIAEGHYDRDVVMNHTNSPFLVRSDNGLLLRERDVMPGGSDKYMVWDASSNKPQPYDTLGITPALTGSYAWGKLEFKPVWQKLVDNVKDWTPDRAAQITDLPAETIVRIAREFGTAKKAKIETSWSPGMQKAAWGENTIYALHSLNVITGNLLGHFPGVRGTGLGVEETLKKLEPPNPVKKRVPVNHLAEAILNPSRYGTDLHAVVIMQGNPVNQNADSNKTKEALKKVDFVVVSDLFMTATAKYADIILPACTNLERTRIFEGGAVATFYYYWLYQDYPQKWLFYSDKAVEPRGECRDDFDVVCDLARRMGLGKQFPWKDSDAWIEDVLNMAKEDPRFPWMKEVTLERLKKEGIVEVDAPPPTTSWQFPTPSGRVELYSEALLKRGYDPLPIYREPPEGRESTPELYKKYPLNMVSPHTIWRSQSSFSNQPEITELHTPNVLIHPADASKRGINNGDTVVVFNDRGSLQIQARVAQEIKPGVVRIYQGGWPEHGMVNLLTGDRLTTYGENPTYNTCLVEVKKAEYQATQQDARRS